MKNIKLTKIQRETLAAALLVEKGGQVRVDSLAEEMSLKYITVYSRMKGMIKHGVVKRGKQGCFNLDRDVCNAVRMIASNPNKDLIGVLSQSKEEWESAGKPTFASSPELRMLTNEQKTTLLENIQDERFFWLGQSVFDANAVAFVEYLKQKWEWLEASLSESE